MAAIVKPRREIVYASDITAGSAVRSPSWTSIANASNYIRGKGRQLVAATSIREVIASGNSATYHFRVAPSPTSFRRVWRILVIGSGRVRSPAGSGTWHTIGTGGPLGTLAPYALVHDLGTASSTEAEATIEFNANGASSFTPMSISLEESPRFSLNLDATDLGVDINTEVAREPIYAEDNVSVYGASKVFTDDSNIRRSALFHWAVNPSTATAPSRAGAAAAFLGLDVPVLGPKLHSGDVTATAKWRAYCITSAAGTSGTVEVTNNRTAVTTTINVPTGSNGAFSWFPATAGAASSFSIDCEDMASTDGRRSAGVPIWNDLTFKISGTAGTLYIAGVSVFHT